MACSVAVEAGSLTMRAGRAVHQLHEAVFDAGCDRLDFDIAESLRLQILAEARTTIRVGVEALSIVREVKLGAERIHRMRVGSLRSASRSCSDPVPVTATSGSG